MCSIRTTCWPVGREGDSEIPRADRPDIKVVGQELVPFGKVQDFSPYIAKIKASGAQSLVTSNYDRDLNLLMKAATTPAWTSATTFIWRISRAGRPRPDLPVTTG